jgi:MFS family permease
VFGLISSAWVLPSLLGPPVAGLVTEMFSWHWVFLGLVPLVVVATALVVPAVRGTGPAEAAAPARPGTVPAALAAAAGVAGLSWAGQDLGPVAVGVGAVSVLLLVPALRVLLPRGVFRAARGVPSVVAGAGCSPVPSSV